MPSSQKNFFLWNFVGMRGDMWGKGEGKGLSLPPFCQVKTTVFVPLAPPSRPLRTLSYGITNSSTNIVSHEDTIN